VDEKATSTPDHDLDVNTLVISYRIKHIESDIYWQIREWNRSSFGTRKTVFVPLSHGRYIIDGPRIVGDGVEIDKALAALSGGPFNRTIPRAKKAT
jgi:hypothetical protein